MQSVSEKQLIGVCVMPDTTNYSPQVANLIQAAGYTVSQLEKQLGRFSEYDNEEHVWQDFVQEVSEDWVLARNELDAAEAALALYETPEKTPLGTIGEILESEYINEAEANLEAAKFQFNKIDQRLRKCDDTLRQYHKIAHEFKAAQKKKTYIKEIRNALGMLDGSMDLSRMALNETLSMPLISDTAMPSEEEIAGLTMDLHELLANMPILDEVVIKEKQPGFFKQVLAKLK